MKPTKFNQVQFDEKKAALAELRKSGPPAASVAALRDRVTRLEKIVGV